MKDLKDIITEKLHINKNTSVQNDPITELESFLKASKGHTWNDIEENLIEMGYEDRSIDASEIFYWHPEYNIGFNCYTGTKEKDAKINMSKIQFMLDELEYEDYTGEKP